MTLNLTGLRVLLRCFGHISHSEDWISHCLSLDVVGKHGKDHPRKKWEEVIQDDFKSWQIYKEGTMDRVIWRGVVKSAAKVSKPCFKEKRC